MKLLRCRDIGFDCEHEIQAESEAEVLQQAAEHTPIVHQVIVTPALAEQVKTLITEETS